MKYNLNFSSLILLVSLTPLGAQVNFSEHIAPIIYDNCTTCHRPGEIGPMSLTNYQEVKNWGYMIEYVTSIRYMPPWKPEKGFSKFLGERYLSDREIELISEWVVQGMPQGDPDLEPTRPEFPKGSQVGEPDLVLSFSEAFTHKGNNKDQYQIFVLPTGLTEDRALKAIELRPGNSKIVHHALFALDTTGEARILDTETPEYGYEGFGGYGIDVVDNYPGYVPGAKARFYPEGVGQKIFANSDLLIQMHYAPVPVDETDSSTVNLFFADEHEQIERQVLNYVMLPFFGTLTNGPFVIRPNTVKTFHGVYKTPVKVSLLGVAPHMHLLGQDWKVFGISPSGDTINLISIPEWDFNWQGFYFYDRFVVLEEGTEIHAYATYDNTTGNPYNPNSPPKFTTWGEGTSDEMFYLPFQFVLYQPGDEDIRFEEGQLTDIQESGLSFPKNKLYPIFPNPGKEEITVGFSLAKNETIALEVVNAVGQVVRRPILNEPYPLGSHQLRISVDQLPQGVYFLKLSGAGFQISETFSVVR